ncbi:hypothetical protein [Paucibacter soli]|uniref:hypothetical protein n=1 Tax=Paucibacter soli TaxID=3133433 RepID=UPI00309D08A6
MRHRIIHIEVEAPPKPALGQPCNGCGICCLAEPCPVGVLLSRRRHGACKALQWSADFKRYRCGMLEAPLTQLGMARFPSGRLRQLLERGLRAWSRRMIAAGIGCDAEIEPAEPEHPGKP